MKAVVSCHQCAMFRICHDGELPKRQEARAIAASCLNPGKGCTTDVVRILGRDRGMSRKNAIQQISDGRLRWVDGWTLMSS